MADELPQSLDDLRAALAAAGPIERARFLAVVTDARNLRELGERRREAVWEAVKALPPVSTGRLPEGQPRPPRPYEVVAEALGVSVGAVNKAFTLHNGRLRGDT